MLWNKLPKPYDLYWWNSHLLLYLCVNRKFWSGVRKVFPTQNQCAHEIDISFLSMTAYVFVHRCFVRIYMALCILISVLLSKITLFFSPNFVNERDFTIIFVYLIVSSWHLWSDLIKSNLVFEHFIASLDIVLINSNCKPFTGTINVKRPRSVLNNSGIKLEKIWSQIRSILHFTFSIKLHRL